MVSAGVRSTMAPPSTGAALTRFTVPRVSVKMTRLPSADQPSRSGRSSAVGASARGAPPSLGTTAMRAAKAQLGGSSDTTSATDRPSGEKRGSDSDAALEARTRTAAVSTSTMETSVRGQSSAYGVG
jgi:hypothetical protein